ncbi:uncharacterized protein LOC142317938 [Lycorma delicatula]|uniref:uncharacterized protein LOC142317938 n=1 Tax=Lycorma delicatula TaxID=130591 RepID=UPI003F513696
MVDINILPVEILWKIFSYIPAQDRIFKVGEVCPYWYQLVTNNDRFMSKITFVIYLEDLYTVEKNDCRKKLDFYEINSSKFSFVPFIKSVKVTTEDIQIFRFNAIQYVLTSYFKNVKKLEFCNVHAIPRSFLNVIFSSLRHLEIFKINMCYFTNVEAFLEMKHLKTLTTFELLNGYYFCDRHLEVLALECPSLNHVWIPDSRAISDNSLINFIKLKQSSLLHLGINGYLITDNAYTALIECQNLITLYVEDARKMTEKGMKVLLKLPKLQNLTLKTISLNIDEPILNLIQSFMAKNKKSAW